MSEKIPDDQRALMINDIIKMRGGYGYPKSQILIGLAHLYHKELGMMAESCIGVVRNSQGDENKARDQITRRLAEKYRPELMELIEETLARLEKDPAAAAEMLGMVEKPKNEGSKVVEQKVEIADKSWIEAGEGTWVCNTLGAVMSQQANVLNKFSEDEKKGGYGFACRLMVGKIDDYRNYSESAEGGIFNLWFNEKGVQPKPPGVPIRNVVCIDTDTLLGIIMPDWEHVCVMTPEGEISGLQAMLYIFENAGEEILLQQLRPSISISDAIANGKILFGGDKPDIDSEIWSKMSSAVLVNLAYPMAIKSLLTIAKNQRGD